MIPEIRENFNKTFDQEAYQAFVADMHGSLNESLVFRVSETPLFLSDEMTLQLIEAAQDVAKTFFDPQYKEKTRAAIPEGMYVAREDDHTTFLQVDFAICRAEDGSLTPQLIELQGFPSLYSFQHYLDTKIRQYFKIPEGFTPFFSGLDSTTYNQRFGKVLLGDSDPENVVLLEYQPMKQKTRIDFHLVEKYFNVKPVCVTEVLQRGNRLFYKDNGREVPIERAYHRFIFDELIRKNVRCNWQFDDEDIDLTWVGHPNWFFRISKYSLPLIDSPYCPNSYFLKDLNEYPADLENYVLKPLFSFAGTGVEIDVDAAMLDAISDRENYILQQKVEYAPFLKTLDIDARAEVRMMFLWDEEKPFLVNNLLRISKGKMMGVDYNKDKTWVGSSLAYHRRK